VSLDGGATWKEVTAAGGAFVSGGYTSTADGVGAAWSGLSGSYPANDGVVVDVGKLAGPNRRVRFRFVADGNTGLEGWHVDDARITNTLKEGTCRPVTTCLEDDASQIEYSTAWHLVSASGASGGHFRLHTGNASGTFARLAFTVPSGKTGAVVYGYATSTKGGSAQLFVDGVSQGTISFAGGAGGLKDPVFGVSRRIANLAAGNHTVELRSLQGAVYLDGFCLETARSSSAPASGPGATTSGASTLAVGQTLARPLSLPAGTTQLSAVADAGILPVRLILADAAGKVIATADGTGGVATIETPVPAAGAYSLKLVNLSAGPLQVWSAATPLVSR
jgi:hypothetical protein